MRFNDDFTAFTLENADSFPGLYYPLASEAGLKSAITPRLSGDSKFDQNTFLFEPVSIEDLTEDRYSRNFWLLRKGKHPWSCTGASVWQMAEGKEHTEVTAGFMWHETTRTSADGEISAKILSFIPVDRLCEIHVVTLRNNTDLPLKIGFCPAFPIYGRSADNIRDHRHVTSLLNRIYVTDRGVSVCPTLSFDERGHGINHVLYYCESFSASGESPIGSWPRTSDFVKGGNLEMPGALTELTAGISSGHAFEASSKQSSAASHRQSFDNSSEASGIELPGYSSEGGEAIGASLFKDTELRPGKETAFITVAGISDDESDPLLSRSSEFKDLSDVKKAFEETKAYWEQKACLKVHTGDPDFDGFLRFTAFQPELRRLFGCSFLPHHDYGRGGRGFRDLWQDCLALVLFNPAATSELLFNNFKAVRPDGTNATIIGDRPGEFKADRNGISRVWMDHGFWPLLTVKLYIDRTGDLDFLLRETTYFRDDENEPLREGSIFEHLLIQNLVRFWDVGAHKMMRLHGADWNDALDMANKAGESVAFTHAYAGNLLTLADLLRELALRGNTKITMIRGIEDLLAGDIESFGFAVEKTDYDMEELAEDLEAKADFLFALLREQEWIDDDGFGRFNGYYNDLGKAVDRGKGCNMSLTGQVFAIMSGSADDRMVRMITESADRLLFDENCGGYRLNTHFKEPDPHMGRAFYFAYGEKENGAVFSHMAVMYANALYQRGFVKEGYKALKALYRQSMDFETSRIYPGIPEYFGRNGRGLYQFLTGAASWYVLTLVNEMYGIKGEYGRLVIEPKLMAEQFDEYGRTEITLPFNGLTLCVEYVNIKHLEYGEYTIREATLNDAPLTDIDGVKTVLSDTSVLKPENRITVYLA